MGEGNGGGSGGVASAVIGKDAEMVKETWLMQAIADYAVPPFAEFRP